MAESKRNTSPRSQPGASKGPPPPPKRTARGLADQPPEETKIRVSIPRVLEGKVLLHLNQLRGLIMNIEIERPSWTAVEALLRSELVAEFTGWLHTLSKGQGRVSEEPR
jgi:hypothetical protein